MATMTTECIRLDEDAERKKNWKRWGPYLAERQWATIREDYSPDGTCWEYFPHDHARSRAYRWGEDGLLGITDRQCRLCFAMALWNERDPILKERLFGLTGPEGNHGEDVKEEYFYIDATPTHSYLKALYNYPQAAFPYRELVAENRRRSPREPEYELADTGVFAGNRYFAVMAEYAKADPEDLLIRITVENHGPETAVLHLLPTIWFRNAWSWGCRRQGCAPKPNIMRQDNDLLGMTHETLGTFYLRIGPDPDGRMPSLLFTENETNMQRLYGVANASAGVKDGFNSYVVKGRCETLNQHGAGTKAAPQGHHHWLLAIPSREKLTRVLGYMLDEDEFLSPFGIRSLSRYHADHPFVFEAGGRKMEVTYAPGESDTGIFGGNSNWRGPIWFPVNYLIIEALERYHHHYGDDLKVELPTGSGNWCNLQQVADELSLRLARLFLPDGDGRRPCYGNAPRYRNDPLFRDLVLFHEYFNGDTGKGLGAEHQTGWTALVVRFLESVRNKSQTRQRTQKED